MNDPRANAQHLDLKPVDHTQVEALLNASFPVPEGRSFFDDFPSWTSERALWMGLLDSSGGLVAAAGALPAEWSVGPSEAPVSIVRIGGVVTRESQRGLGLASRIVGELGVLAHRAGAQGVVLWGEDSPLYRRLGFTPLGHQLRVPLSGVVSALDRAPAFLRLEEGFSSDVFLEMNQRRRKHGGALLSVAEAEELLSYRHTQWARVIDAEGRLAGYGAFGKGIDLGRQIHEWGGTPEAIRMLARWALSLDPEAEIMGNQPMLEEAFSQLPAETIVESLCLAKFFDSELEALLRSREDHLWFWGIDGV